MSSSNQKRNPQLYVARLASHVTKDDIKHKFRHFGRINSIVLKNRYCFIEYDNYKDSNDALEEMDGSIFEGNRIVVQKAGDNKDRRRSAGRGPSSSDRCFNCGRKGHWANECRYYRRHSRHNSSSYSKSRSSSYSKSRSSSRSDSKNKRDEKSRRHRHSNSNSKQKSISKSHSQSHSKESKKKSEEKKDQQDETKNEPQKEEKQANSEELKKE